ncbi:hypothetical protein Tco_1090127 [Tanacetum coccineum]|uniref:Uncharacterized protein n=1 Tax=Tanacetum coccineum TaxID=301880 RepID=A0ABQ5I488_9ASTR
MVPHSSLDSWPKQSLNIPLSSFFTRSIESMKDCNISDRLLKLNGHLSSAWNWRRFIQSMANAEHAPAMASPSEEFTQSIHFTEDKRKLAQTHTSGERSNFLLLPVSGAREVLGWTIPNEIINNVIEERTTMDAIWKKLHASTAGKVVKKRTVKSSKQLVDEFIEEGVPAAKPSLEDTEEAILQKVLQESLTDAYPTQRGPLPPVVFRETDTGKFQPLPEVPGKGKRRWWRNKRPKFLSSNSPREGSAANTIFPRRSQFNETAGVTTSIIYFAC